MKTTHALFYIFVSALALLLQGCAVTGHPVTDAAMGRPSGSAEMERLLDQPGPVALETVASADWSVSLAGMVNLKRPAAIAAGLQDRDEPIQVYAHVLKHPKYGNFLVDTGISRKLVDDPAGSGVSWLVREVMHIDKLKIRKSTAEILQELNGPLSGVFFTHLHVDHIAGLPDIPADTPLYIAWPEATEGRSFKYIFTRGSTNDLLAGKPLREWHFQPDPQGKFEGVMDVFGDGSVFAISVPGHTPGSVAYVVRTPQGPVLLTGDTSHTRWGWEHGVEPGDYTDDNDRNLKSLQRLKALADRHPNMAVRLGHQP